MPLGPTSKPQWNIALPLLFPLLLAGCGDELSPPSPQDAIPNPDGVLLAGDNAANAASATKYLPPYPAAPADIEGDLLATRLEAIIAPQSTVGALNELLTTHDARIISMDTENPFVTLKIPRVLGEAGARAFAQALSQSGLLYAFPAFRAKANKLPPSGAVGISHLTAAGWPAAWNASAAVENTQRVKVLVPDFYSTNFGSPAGHHPEIDAQHFNNGWYFQTDIGIYRADCWNPEPGVTKCTGNHGFSVCGILGANFDGTAITGTSSDPIHLMSIESMPVDGFSIRDQIQEIWAAAGGGRFVLNLSIGYPDTLRTPEQYAWRAIYAMEWRHRVESRGQDAFISSAASNIGDLPGDQGLAKYDSYANSDMMIGDLRTMVNLAAVGPVLAALVQGTHTRLGVSNSPTMNGLVVGNSDDLGNEVENSGRDTHVRCQGQLILCPCEVNDSFCTDRIRVASGTSMAAPQVAGLAAYLWNLDPSLTPQRIAQIIRHAFNQYQARGLVHAYTAALALDNSVAYAPVRGAVLDVTGPTLGSSPNLAFDEVDLEEFLYSFRESEALRENTGNHDPDYGRYDLNGDGWTGGIYTDQFDLTADNPSPSWTTVPQTVEGTVLPFDETDLTDDDILLYYAYSSLYTGDPDRRAELFCQFPFSSLQIADVTAFPGCSDFITVDSLFTSLIAQARGCGSDDDDIDITTCESLSCALSAEASCGPGPVGVATTSVTGEFFVIHNTAGLDVQVDASTTHSSDGPCADAGVGIILEFTVEVGYSIMLNLAATCSEDRIISDSLEVSWSDHAWLRRMPDLVLLEHLDNQQGPTQGQWTVEPGSYQLSLRSASSLCSLTLPSLSCRFNSSVQLKPVLSP